MAWPSAMRSALSVLRRGHAARPTGRRRRGAASAVWTVKSPGETSSRSSHDDRERHGHAGSDPRAVGRDHGGAADPRRVDEHLAAAVLLHERGRGDARDRAARPAPRWRGSPPPSPPSRRRRRSARTRAHPWRRWSSPRPRGRRRRAPGARGGRPARPSRTRRRSGGSRSSTRWVTWSGRSARTSVGWYSTARWLANHSSVRRSLHSAYDTSRFDVSAHSGTVRTQSGVYFGTFFCMNASWPRWTRITDSGRSSQHGDDPVAHAVEVVDQVALRRVGPVEQRLVEVGQRHPVARTLRCS